MNVDMKIYIESFLNKFEEFDETLKMNGFDSIRMDFGIDEDVFDHTIKSALREEIAFYAEATMIERDDYTLSESQFESAVVKTATRVLVDDMVMKGILMATVDPEQGENVYSLTDLGREISKKLNKD